MVFVLDEPTPSALGILEQVKILAHDWPAETKVNCVIMKLIANSLSAARATPGVVMQGAHSLTSLPCSMGDTCGPSLKSTEAGCTLSRDTQLKGPTEVQTRNMPDDFKSTLTGSKRQPGNPAVAI